MNTDKNPRTTTPTTNDSIGGLTHIMNSHIDPSVTTTTLNSSRTHTSPLMGTSARAAKRRIDGDTGPIRIDGTDTYNQQLQHHYQNVRQILDDQQQNQISNIDQSNESRQTFITKKDSLEQRVKPSPLTYDSPLREQQQPPQKIITTITTTTKTTPTLENQPNSSLNDSSSSSVGRLLEQAAELQKLTNINSNKSDSQQPLIIERTEQYQVFLDPKNHEVLRTANIPITKTSHATDLDQAQTDRFIDDHEAIQQLTRVLQEHNTTTVNEYKRLPSQSQSNSILINTTTTTTTKIPSNIVLVDRTNQPITSEFTVVDALLDNPLGTNNNKQNNKIHVRFNDILSNIRNSEYVNALKQTTTKVTKKKSESDQNSSLNSNEKKNSKKMKSKQSPKDINYQVIDAIISSPVSLYLPESYLTKYKVNPPLTQLSPIPSITRSDNNILLPQQLDTKAGNETVYDLVKIVNDLMLHHTAVSTASSTTGKNRLQQSVRPTYLNQVHQPHLITNPNQSSESIEPRILYRYVDQKGNILKFSLTPPSQLYETHPEESQQNFHRNTEPTYFHSRQIAVNDQRHHFIPDREQHTTWQTESKLPTTVIKEDIESRDKRIPKLSGQPSSTTRTIPISIEREHTIKTPFQQQHISHHPNQQNVQLNWLPLSYQLGQPYIPGDGTFGYETDSTISEHSILHRPYDHAPIDTHYHYHHRPLFQNTYHNNTSPIHPYYSSPSRLPYNTRDTGPDHSGTTVSRNYIEVFRDGEMKPSEVYSLLIDEPIATTSGHHSRYDQYQLEKSEKTRVPSSSPYSKYERIIPSLSNHNSYPPHTIQHGPYHDQIPLDNYVRQSKSYDYRPLRTKLQREYKITPNLLVDEWDHPEQSTKIDYTKQFSSASSPDDVFIKYRRHAQRPNKKQTNSTNGNTEQQTWTNNHEFVDSNQQKPEYKSQSRLISQPIYKALALHSFYAQTSRELSFKKGDILLVLRRINDDWLEGEYQGIIGIFPLNHVELFPIETTEQEDENYEIEQEIQGEAIVKYDFIPQKTFELQLRKGDKVILLRRLDNNWYEGRLNHIEGIFPAAYVETLREPSEFSSKNSPDIEHIQLAKQISPELEERSTEKIDTNSDLSLPLRKCQVLYDYTPQNPDELEIHVGDIINVIEMCDDGWYCGIMDKSNRRNNMEFGTFPGNYVKLLPI